VSLGHCKVELVRPEFYPSYILSIHPSKEVSFCELLKKTHLKLSLLPVIKKITFINNNRKLSRAKKLSKS